MGPQVQPVLYTQIALSRHPDSAAQPQNDVVWQLLPTLVAFDEAFQHLAYNQSTQPSASTPAPLVV